MRMSGLTISRRGGDLSGNIKASSIAAFSSGSSGVCNGSMTVTCPSGHSMGSRPSPYARSILTGVKLHHDVYAAKRDRLAA